MNIREIVLSEIRKIGEEQATKLASLTDDLNLMDSGLDSLGFAILVTRLAPLRTRRPYPETIGDLINLYENATARV